MSTRVEIDDVQSLVFSGHAKLPAALALGLAIHDKREARRTLRDWAQRDVVFGFGDKSRQTAAQLLLTAAGIAELGGAEEDLPGLSRQFRQGMVTPPRSRALGDAAENAPETWAWDDQGVHAVILIYAIDARASEAKAGAILGELAPGWSLSFELPIDLPADGCEPFGFRDGLSMTRVDVGNGQEAESPGVALLAPGEVVLGCENAAGIVPPVPPLGENGTYVVVRQLEQDVQAFWAFWRREAKDEPEAVWLAAKALGRWPNGMPVSGSQPGPEPAFDEAQAFAPLEFANDPRGLKCPFGAHVRRANPRDGLGDDPAASLEGLRHHRIVRRGRVYGPPAPAGWYPASFRAAKRSGDTSAANASRGLLFVALCADIARQFEFIQQTWLNNPKFSDLYDEVDPIAAGHGIPGDSRSFSIPRAPIRCRISGVTRWVRVRAGGYFLMPGKRALQRFLA